MQGAALPLETVRIALALAGVLVGAYFDLFNDKNVPDLFLYAFVAVGLLINLVPYDPLVSPFAIASGALVFGAFYLLYKFGQLGGADGYILTAVALLLPFQPQSLLMVGQSSVALLPFIFNLILASGISFMVYMLVRSVPIAISALGGKGGIERNALLGAGAVVLAFGVFSWFFSQMPFLSFSYYVFVAVIVALSVYFTLFKTAINRSMVKWVEAKDAPVEEIIAVDMMEPELVKKYALGRLVTPAQHERMKHIKGKKIALYAGLPPFVPHILIGLVACLLLGNIVMFFASA